jgi:hypothetical protein
MLKSEDAFLMKYRNGQFALIFLDIWDSIRRSGCLKRAASFFRENDPMLLRGYRQQCFFYQHLPY